MKNINFRVAFIALGFLFVIASCSKSNDANSGGNNGSIVGTWTISELGTDANSNNVVDAGETVSAALVGVSGTITFKSDNTVSSTTTSGGTTDNESGTYTYSNGTIVTTTNGTSTSATVNSVTANKLVLKDASTSPAGWLILTK